jgi:hypothetical protein
LSCLTTGPRDRLFGPAPNFLDLPLIFYDPRPT